MQNKQTLSDMVFDVKEKLSDEEYKNIMEKIGEQRIFVKLRYQIFKAYLQDDEPSPEVNLTFHTTICQVVDYESDIVDYHQIHDKKELSSEMFVKFKTHKDDKHYWPMCFRGCSAYMSISEFEEL